MRIQKNYKTINLPSLNDNQLKEIELLKNKSDDSIDLKDIPEVTINELKTGHFYYTK